MRVTVCQLDNRPEQLDEMLAQLASHITSNRSQLLVLPEMCFSEWLAADRERSRSRWLAAIKAHADQILKLDQLGCDAVIGTRPVINREGSFRNQAYLWTPQPKISAIHEKCYLPDEAGYWEASWYERGERSFETCQVLDSRIGVQICTEMWFLEWARRYARQQVELLCIPRATPHESLDKWLAGGRTAAVCSGAYCLSSNIWNPVGSKADCGGMGWIISPEGDVLAQTSEQSPFASAELDLEFARRSKTTYPRYVAE